jgi:hypothetical protein
LKFHSGGGVVYNFKYFRVDVSLSQLLSERAKSFVVTVVKEKSEPEQYPLQRRHFDADGFDLGHVQTFYPPSRTSFDQFPTPVSITTRESAHAWYNTPPPMNETPVTLKPLAVNERIEMGVTIELPCCSQEDDDPMLLTKKDIDSFMNTYATE